MNFRKIILLPVIIGILLFPTLAAGKTVIQTGGMFFIGEGNLDVIPAFYGTDATHQQNLTWFHEFNPSVNQLESMLKFSMPSPPPEILSNYTAVPSDWRGYFGGWNRGLVLSLQTEDCTLAFYVRDPMIDISIIDAVNQTDISGKSVKAGTPVDFVIRSNLYLVAHDQNRTEPMLPSKGFIDIKVISPSGELLTSVPDAFGTQKNLTGLYVDTNPYLWGKGDAWDTARGTGECFRENIPRY